MPIDAEELFEVLKDLDLPRECYVVAGSGPLLAHGLRGSIADLDIVASGPAWSRVAAEGEIEIAPYDGVHSVHLLEGRVEVLDGWFPIRLGWKPDCLIGEADIIMSFRFFSLQKTLEWKESLDRKKDREDVASLRNFLATRSNH